MDKTAFLIFGPEGSGTYMLAEAFASVGCFYDDKLRESVPDDFHEKVVARLSLPCAGKFTSPKKLYNPYLEAGYRSECLVILRDANASRQSVVERDAMRSRGVLEEYRRALEHIAGIFSFSTPVSYEAFVRSAGYRKWLFEFFGLSEPKGTWFDGNEKYYAE